MVNYGEWPLVLQKETQGGVLVPVGLAESSALGNLTASSITATTVSATNWQNLPTFGGNFTGVIDACSVGSGTPILDSIYNSDTLQIKSIAFNNFGNFFEVTTVPGAEVNVNFDEPLPVVNGGTGTNTFTNGGLIYYDALSFPAALTSEPALTYNTTTNTINSVNVCATGNVCAAVFVEGGTPLVNKYQPSDATLTTIASQNPGANSYIYFTGTNVAATGTITSQARNLLADATASEMQDTIGLSLAGFGERILFVDISENLSAAPLPTDNTYLKYTNADGYAWVEVTATGGSVTLPSVADRILVSVNSTTTTGEAELTYNTTTNTINFVNGSATGNVCATTFVENGTSLISKYLTIANATATYQPTGSYLTNPVNLATQVTGSLLVVNGGTANTSFTDNGIVYKSGIISEPTLVNTGTFTYNETASRLTVTNASATTVSAGVITEGGVSLASKYQATGSYLTAPVDLASEVTDTLPITNGGTGTTSFVNTGLVYYNSLSFPAQLQSDTELTYNATNNTLSVSNISVSAGVSANTFVENGVSLASKYQATGSYLTTGVAAATYQPLDSGLTQLADNTATGVIIFSGGSYSPLANGSANTFLKYTGTGYIWTGTDGTATLPGGSNGQIQVNDSNSFGGFTGLTFSAGTNTLHVVNACAVGNVCAASFVEGGTSLTAKYLTIANAATTYQPTGSYLTTGVAAATYQPLDGDLTDIAGLAYAANTFIYKNAGNTFVTGTVTPCAISILDDATFGDMRNTLGLSALATKSIVTLTTDVTGTLPIAYGGTNQTSFNSNGVAFFDGTRLNTDTDLTFSNNLLSTSAVSSTVASSVTFVEGGTSLASKYLTIANAAATYQPIGAYLTAIPAEYLTESEGNAAYQPINTKLFQLTGVNTTGVMIFTAGSYVSLPNGAVDTFLKYTAAGYIWTGTDGGSTSPGGSDTQIQYNNSNSFAGDADLTWNSTTNTLKSLNFSSVSVTAGTAVVNGIDLNTTLAAFPTTYADKGVIFFDGAVTNAEDVFTYDSVTNRLSVSAVSATIYNNIALSSQLTDVQVTGAVTTGHVLKWNGTKWAPAADDTGSGGSPAGGNTEIQFNNTGAFGSDEVFTYNSTTDLLKVPNVSATTVSAGTLHLGGSDGYLRNNNGAIWISATDIVRVQPSLSATTYFNLPSGTAIWNASKLQGVDLTYGIFGALADTDFLIYSTAATSWLNINPTVAASVLGPIAAYNATKLQSVDIATTAPATNEVLKYNGTNWAPANPNGLNIAMGNNLF